MFRAGFAQIDVTPSDPVHLAGYFNDRVATETLDPLFVRAAVFDDGDNRVGIVVSDICMVPREYVLEAKKRIAEETGLAPTSVVVSATHTHTAPAPRQLFDVPEETVYVKSVLIPAMASALRTALANLSSADVCIGVVEERGLAFCRRYWMKDGTVVTNPPKGHSDIVGPEAEIDHSISVVRFSDGDRVLGALVNINNHSDTTGGSRISADWPGHMSRLVSEGIGQDVPIILLYGLSGNVNHFDPAKPFVQTGPDEARRIGTQYARFVQEAFAQCRKVDPTPVGAITDTFSLPYRRITERQLSEARRLVEMEVHSSGENLTAEDLAKGSIVVEQMFARMLLEFVERYGQGGEEEIEIAVLRIGPIAFVGLPGEPFSQIGMRIKQGSPFRHTCVLGLANGAAGYIPLEESFTRGGYEIRTTPGNRFREDTATVFVERSIDALNRIGPSTASGCDRSG